MISILPLRKNSKRIKNKNKKIINGKHLYEFILNELLKSKQIKKVIITTDYKLNIKNSKIKKLIITDSIDNSNKIKNNNKIEVLSISSLMSEAIKRIANSNSVSDLFN